jgi:hypothetical protein
MSKATTAKGSSAQELAAILTWWFRSWRRPAGSISRNQHAH